MSEDAWFYQKAIEAGLAVIKDFLAARLTQKNAELLDKKKKALKSERPNVSADELIAVVLQEPEVCKCEFSFPTNEAVDAMQRHLQRVRDWSSKIHFLDLVEDKEIYSSYVDLDAYLVPIKLHVDEIEKNSKVPFAQVLRTTDQHLAILGQPGAGKTTSMQKICFDLLKRDTQDESERTLPVLIRFRDLPQPNDSADGVICRALRELFPLSLRFDGALAAAQSDLDRDQIHVDTMMELIDAVRPVIILDGLDEYPYSSAFEGLIKDLRRLANGLKRARLIVTCRSGEFNYSISNMRLYELAPLSRDQIKDFAERWLGNKREAADFLQAVMQSPFADTAIKPLSLAHLCTIFKRVKKIPDRPKVVYRKVVGLLIDKWDEQRSIRRTTSYAQFEPDRKFEFLCQLAYEVTTRFQATVISHSMLIDAYESICHYFSLPVREAQVVAREIESHTGLLLEGGFEKYEFAHKSIQEYLTAEHIVRLPMIPNDQTTIIHLGGELAISVSISSSPTQYLCYLAFQVLPGKDLGHGFYTKFFSRMALEKPDLVRNVHVIIALFSLPTLWLNRGSIHSSDSYERAYGGDDVTLLNEHIASFLHEGDLAVLREHYEPAKRRTYPGLIRCNIRKLGQGFKYPQYILIPDKFSRHLV
jgi:hypothetical protein